MHFTAQDEESPDLDILDSREAGGQFLRGGGLRVLAFSGAVAASVGAVPLVARHLHAATYGRYVTITSLLLIVQALTEGGIANLGVREFADGGLLDRRSLMSSLLGLRIALSLLGSAGAVAFAAVAGYPSEVVEGTAIACAGLMLINLQATLSVPLTAALRLPWLALFDFLGPAITAAGLVVCVVLATPLPVFFAATAPAYFLTTTITAVLVRGQVSLRPAFSRRRWRALLAESFVFAAATALAVVYFQLVVVAMSLLASSHEVGIFSLTFRILSVVNAVPLVVIGSAFPILLRAARDDRTRLRYALRGLLDGNLLLGGSLSLLLVVGAPFVTQVMGGSEYPGSASVLRILGCGVIATFLAAVFAFGLLSLRMYRALVVINASMVALAVALCAVLIPAYGARGAAFVTLILEVVLAIAYGGMLFARHPELRPRLNRTLRILCSLALAFAVGLVIPLSSPLAALSAFLTLAVAAGLTRTIPPELMAAVRGRAPRGPSR